MQTTPARGAFGGADLAGVVLSLRLSSSTGRLRLEREGVHRDLFLRDGLLIAADSSAPTDALEWLLFTAGVLSEERHAEVRALIGEGARRGTALIESGCLSPAGLCEWTERRARFLASDSMTWKTGTWEFETGTTPPEGAIVVRLHPAELMLTALRQRPATWLSSRLPAADRIPEPIGPLDGLMPHEEYVLSLASGRRTVSEICRLSELGEAGTLEVLALLLTIGCLREKGAAPAVSPQGVPASGGEPAVAEEDPAFPIDLPAGDSTAEMRAVVRIYNEMFVFVYAHMIKEVGPIAEQLLDKHLREARDRHAALFARTWGGRDGSFPEDALMRNVNLIRDQNRRDLLVAGLHDYLKAMILAVRRILGADHELLVLRRLRETRCTRT